MRPSGLTLAATLAAAFFLVSHADAAECRVKWAAQWAADAQGYMWVTSGQQCRSEIYTGYGKIDSVTIASPAREGTASARGRFGIDYKSKPGFVGEDHFVVAIVGESPTGVKGVTRITFQVIVSKS